MKTCIEEIEKTGSYLILIDEQLNESNGYLRSLHFIYRMSEGRIRKFVVWEPGRNCNKPLDTTLAEVEYIHPSSFLPSNDLHCVFVNDEKEEKYQYVGDYVEFQVPSVFVVNHANFIPKVWSLSHKPLESKTPLTPRYFKTELNKYLDSIGLNHFQLSETRNLAFTEVNYLHQAITSERANVLTDLLNFEDEKLAISPIWDWAINLLRLKEENRVSNMYVFIFNAFRPLIERNKSVEKTARVFDSFLKRCRYNLENLDKRRWRNLKKMTDNYQKMLKTTKETLLSLILQKQLLRLQCL